MKNFFLIFSFFFACYFCFSQNATSSTQSALELFEAGCREENAGRFLQAQEFFSEAISENPAFGNAYFHLANVTYELDDFSLALSYADEAQKFLKDDSELSILRGYILISLGRLAEAEEIFLQTLKNRPNDVEARFGLAQIQIFDGRLDDAKNYYLDALKRESSNRKALLSLALLSFETENFRATENYIAQAIRFHSGNADTHYLAAYLAARNGKLQQAEKSARTAVQIEPNMEKAYILLSLILYAQKNYQQAIDFCDFLISRNRNLLYAWFLKGLSEAQSGFFDEALSTWNTALSDCNEDEVMRMAMELLAEQKIAIEDSRRKSWADFHAKNAAEAELRYDTSTARYEYRRALQLDPSCEKARKSFAELFLLDGFNERYLSQLKFLQEQKNQNANLENQKKSLEDIRTQDSIEAYDALLKNTLATKWNVNPFYLEKPRWKIGVYCVAPKIRLLHPTLEKIFAGALCDVFSASESAQVELKSQNVSGFAEARKLSRASDLDYFLVLTAEETERDFFVKADLYSARTGILTKNLSVFRTGNSKFSSAVRAIRDEILDLLPIRSKILSKKGNLVLVSLGKFDGILKNSVFAVIEKGKIKTADSGPGLFYPQDAILAKVTAQNLGEDIFEGELFDTGFYDRVNEGDEVVLLSLPDENGNAILPQSTEDILPTANSNGKKLFFRKKDSQSQKKEIVQRRVPEILRILQSVTK